MTTIDRLREIAEHAERAAEEARGRGELLSRLALLELAVMARAAMDPGGGVADGGRLAVAAVAPTW